MKNRVTKFISTALIVATLSSLFTIGSYAETTVTSTQDSSVAESGATIPVMVNAEAPIFKAVVPLNLPVAVDGNGDVTVATVAKIENKSSYGNIVVKGAKVSPDAAWTIASYTDAATFKALPNNSKTFGFTINNCPATASTGAITVNSTDFSTIQIGSQNAFSLTYNVLIAPQTGGLMSATIGSVVFTIGWDE